MFSEILLVPRCWLLLVGRASWQDVSCRSQTDLGVYVTVIRREQKSKMDQTYIMTSVIRTGLAGRSAPSFRGSFSKVSKTSSPPTSLPKTVCLLSRCGVALNVMYHWDLALTVSIYGNSVKRLHTHLCQRPCLPSQRCPGCRVWRRLLNHTRHGKVYPSMTVHLRLSQLGPQFVSRGKVRKQIQRLGNSIILP